MKEDKNKEKVLDFIKANPNVSIEAITAGTKVSDIMTRKALKDLQAEEMVEVDADDGTYKFKMQGSANDSKATEKKTAKEESDLGPPTPSGRDNSKYSFDGVQGLPKGRFVLAIVRKHAEAKKLTLAKLQDVFDSKTIQPRFGVVEEINAAKKFSKNGKDRYLVKPEDVFKTSDGKKAVVCSQWTSDNIKPFIKIAKELGYKFKVE